MKPIWHIISSLILGALFFYFTKSINAGFIILLAGVFIDLDHILDFWKSRSKNFKNQKTFVLWHGYEYLIILFVLAYYLNWPVLLNAFIAGIALHYLLDVYNLKKDKKHVLSYFLIFRIVKRFTINKN